MFLGVGLGKAIAIAVFTIVFIVFAKVVLNKYPVQGLTDVVNAV